jgi:glycosyltransferase involved in cell wall biosynthesis
MTIGIVSTIRKAWGGSEELWAALAMEALSSGHSIIISAFDCGAISPKTRNLIDAGALMDWRIGEIPKATPQWKYFLLRFKRVYRKKIGNPFIGLFRYKPDLIFYVGTAYSIVDDRKLLKSLKRSKASLFLNIQLNTEFKGQTLSSSDRTLARIFYRRSKWIYFVSERNKAAAEMELGEPIKNASVIRNPVNLEFDSIVPFPKSSKVNMAMVGNLVTIHKGQDIVLNALTDEKWHKRDWHLNIYGDGEDFQKLYDMSVKNQLSNRVSFLGRVSNIREVWANNHILLMPSLMEGMPLAVVEAMLCGRPTVATDVGGHREWITEGQDGWISPKTAVPDFQHAMEKAWQCKEQWEVIGQKAHEKAKAMYDPKPGKTLLNQILNSLKD